MRRLVLVALLLALVTPALAGPPVESPPVSGVDLGSALRLGFGVAPLRSHLPPALPGGTGTETGRPAEPDGQGTALSFDLRLRWPGSEASPLEPYLVFGPALFVLEPDQAGRLLGTRVDPSLRVGARAGAGLNWKIGRDLTLFGAYEMTTAADAAVPALGARPAGESDLDGHGVNYGLRFRF